MHQRAYSHLTDGTQALIVQFVKEPENDELLLKAFNEVASNNALNAKEVKNLAIDEFRKEIQHLATKDELNGLRYELIATKEALQGQIDGVRGELQGQIDGVKSELQVQKDDIRHIKADYATKDFVRAEINASKNELIKWILGTGVAIVVTFFGAAWALYTHFSQLITQLTQN